MILLFVALLLDPAGSKKMTFKFNSDISDKANWIGNELAENCKGIHFAASNPAPIFLKDLTTEELVLPQDGNVYVLGGGTIQFKDNKKCIKLKPIEYHDWYDPDSWIESEDNAAVPHRERVPCDHDDVVLPHGIYTRVKSDGENIRVKSIKFAEENLDGTTLDQFTGTLIGQEIFYSQWDPFHIDVLGEDCKNPKDCLCHKSPVQCPLLKSYRKPSCLDPVVPENFCHEICGAYVTFKPGTTFRMEDLRKKLTKYSVDTHASRVMMDYHSGNDVIQVVFSEKEYSGRSVEEAQNFLQEIKSYQVTNPKIHVSGKYYQEGTTSSVWGIVFGTLVAVAAFFALIFYVNGGTTFDVITSRFSRGRGFSVVPFFARFDNTDENLIIDSQSVMGSVLDLPKSFDNPLYGQGSTSEENPLYDVKLKEEQSEE